MAWERIGIKGFMGAAVPKVIIKVAPERCTGCLRCQLACSERYTGLSNPMSARISIQLAGSECRISFTPECTVCGTCVEQCFYGALVMEKQGAGS